MFKEIIEKLGGIVTENIDDSYDVFVTDSIRYNPKLLSALVRGIPILHNKWIIDSYDNRAFITDYEKYMITDQNIEQKYHFSIRSFN